MKQVNVIVKRTPKIFSNNIMLKINFQKIALILLPILILTGNSVKAQKAPEFSNKILPDNKTYFYFVADRFEYYSKEGTNPLVWDVQGIMERITINSGLKQKGKPLLQKKKEKWNFKGYTVAR